MAPPLSGRRRLRIAGGTRRGLQLQVPAGIRPTSGRLRETLFDLWAGRVAGCRFLDLFAGSGAVGLEAASRGAARSLLVEGERRVLAVLSRNRRAVDLEGVAELAAWLPDGLRRRLGAGERFDLVFADPPYGFAAFEELLAVVEPFLAKGGEIALEHPWRQGAPEPPRGLVAARSRRYGDSGLTLYRRTGAAGG